MKILKTNNNISKILLFISLIMVTFVTYFFLKIGFFFINIGYNSLFSIDNYKEYSSEYNLLAEYIINRNIEYGTILKNKDEFCMTNNCILNSLNINIYDLMKNLKISSFHQSNGEIIISLKRYIKGSADNSYFYKKDYFKTVDYNKPYQSPHTLNVNSQSRIIEKINDSWAIVEYD